MSDHVEPPPWISPATLSNEQSQAVEKLLKPLLDLMIAEGYTQITINRTNRELRARIVATRNRTQA